MQVDLLENSSSEIVGVYTGYLKVNRITGKVLGQIIPIKRGNIFNDMLIKNCIAPSSLLLKKECFEKVGLFDESIHYSLDHDMRIRISKEFHFEYIREPLVKYYIHENRLSTNYRLVIRGREALLEKHSQLLALNKRSHSYHYLSLGISYCYSGNTKEGRRTFLKAIELYLFNIRFYFNFFLSILGADNFKKLKEIRKALVIRLSRSE